MGDGGLHHNFVLVHNCIHMSLWRVYNGHGLVRSIGLWSVEWPRCGFGVSCDGCGISRFIGMR